MQPRGRLCALVVTAAAVLTLGSAPAALARTSGVEAQSTVKPADLIPDASWHGRAIRRPDRTQTQLHEPRGSVLVQQGAGLRRPGGSGLVREVQRRLRALGYRTGPVDGAFGPRTRSSVAWFQIKHRLLATGAVDGATLGLLRFRTHGVRTASADTGADRAGAPQPEAAALGPTHAAPQAHAAPSRHAAPAAHAARPAHAAPQRQAAPAAHRPVSAHSGGSTLLTIFALALALLAVAVLAQMLRTPSPLAEGSQLDAALHKWRCLAAELVSTRRRTSSGRPQRVPARSAAARRGRPGGAAAAKPSPVRANGRTAVAANAPSGRPVIGYALGRSDSDLARQVAAMQRVCGGRGWTLGALVKEREKPLGKERRRPGLAHVLSQVAAGGVGQLIVGRLQSLARSPAELAALLEWFGRHGVGVVALDVGLDTSTAEGRLAARCLGAVSPPDATQASRRAGAKRVRSEVG